MGINVKKHSVLASALTGLLVIVVISASLGLAIRDENTDLSNSDTMDWLTVEQTEQMTITLQATSEEHTRISYNISDFSMQTITIDGTAYLRLSVDGASMTNLKGYPELPSISRSFIIPDTKRMQAHIEDAIYEEIHDVTIPPSKGALTRDTNPEEIPYSFGAIYTADAWYPSEPLALQEPYVLRDFRGQVVTFYPFQYNPARQILRAYTHVTVDLDEKGQDTRNCLYRECYPSILDRAFFNLYQSHFLNFDTLSVAPSETSGNLLVIAYDDFWGAMQPLVGWKTMKGIPTAIVNVSELGDAEAIKSYISEFYQEKGLTYVLLVGDAEEIPTLFQEGPSDPSYGYLVGKDHYPDIVIGRFSAETTEDVVTQVQRTIAYEKYPQSDADWYHRGTGIASKEGPGDAGESDNIHMENIREDLLGYTYDQVDQFYGMGRQTEGVTAVLNDGRGIINYCGHGWTEGWSTTGFSNIEVQALNNTNCWPFIVSVACSNGNFPFGTCFAESWLRATSHGNPIGAVAVFMSSVTMGWDPPMAAQDEIVDNLVGANDKEQITEFGPLMISGCIHMNDVYGEEGYRDTDAWHIFGDPTLEVRTDTPTSLEATHAQSIREDDRVYTVTVPSAIDVCCTLSADGILLGSSYTDSSGVATIQLTQPIPETTSQLDLTITAYNRVPLIETLQVLRPKLALMDIRGGLMGITIQIGNEGGLEAKDGEWKMTLDGGSLLTGDSISGTLPSLQPGEQTLIHATPIIGFGTSTCTVQAIVSGKTPVVQQKTCWLLGFFVVFNQGSL
jgi:gingipain R